MANNQKLKYIWIKIVKTWQEINLNVIVGNNDNCLIIINQIRNDGTSLINFITLYQKLFFK